MSYNVICSNNVISCLNKHPICTIDELIDNLDKLCRKKQCDVYVCGNFNINILIQTSIVAKEFDNVFIA